MRTTHVPLRTVSSEVRPVRSGTPNERRRRASRDFLLRAFVLVALIGGVAYLSWFSRWAKPIHALQVESVQPALNGRLTHIEDTVTVDAKGNLIHPESGAAATVQRWEGPTAPHAANARTHEAAANSARSIIEDGASKDGNSLPTETTTSGVTSEGDNAPAEEAAPPAKGDEPSASEGGAPEEGGRVHRKRASKRHGEAEQASGGSASTDQTDGDTASPAPKLKHRRRPEGAANERHHEYD